MGLLDLLSLIIDNLSRRKARVSLTAIGVVIGTASVVILVSLAIGLQMNATEQLYGIGDLTQIQVYPSYGGEIIPGSSQPASQKMITNSSLVELSEIPGVAQVIPRDYLMGSALIQVSRMETYPNLIGVGENDLSLFGFKSQAGTLTLQKGTAIIGAMVSSQFYYPQYHPGQGEPEPPELLDKTVKLVIIKWDPQDGTEIRKTVPIRITGIISESKGESDYSIYVPISDLTTYNEWVMGRRINRNKDGYNLALVIAEDVKDVLDITDQIIALGYQAYTPQSFVQGINSFFVILQVIFGGVGAIALLVAAIGIANTMAMAILERTREIGLMKALGATNRDILSVFLGEAAGIGFIGGMGGIIVGWLAGQVINVVALAYLAGQAAQQGGPLPTTAVYTPLWLPVFTLIFATIIGLLSGLYPALRAATLIPINALKYE
jgi:putative ABC transport system permease protein